MRVPGPARFLLNVREAGPCRGIWNPDNMIAGRTLNPPPGVTRIALQRLITMEPVKLEFVRARNVSLHHGHFVGNKDGAGIALYTSL